MNRIRKLLARLFSRNRVRCWACASRTEMLELIYFYPDGQYKCGRCGKQFVRKMET